MARMSQAMLEGGRSRITLRPFTDLDQAIRWATTGEEPAKGSSGRAPARGRRRLLDGGSIGMLVVPRGRIELPTPRFSVVCSTS